MKKVLLLLMGLLILASVSQASEAVLKTIWVRIGQDSSGAFHYFSSASLKQYPPNDGTVFDVSVRSTVSDEKRKKDKRLARVYLIETRAHYDGLRGVCRILGTTEYDAQAKVIRSNDDAGPEIAIEPNSIAEQTIPAVQAWLAKNDQ